MTKGLGKGLTNYGDEAFALFHRKVFHQGNGLHRRRARSAHRWRDQYLQ